MLRFKFHLLVMAGCSVKKVKKASLVSIVEAAPR